MVVEAKYLPVGSAGHWVATWVAMPQLTEPHNMPPEPFTQPSLVFPDTTLRQTIHVSIGGKLLRVRFSNAFGDTALTISKASIALPGDGRVGGSAIRPESEKPLTFNGRAAVTIPAGAQIVSDPVRFDLAPLSNLAVTIYTAKGQPSNNITSHPGSRTTSYMLAGDHVSEVDLPGATSTDHWYFLSCVEVWAEHTAAAVVILGDSLTDGRGSTTNQNDRWPDLFSQRLQRHPSTSKIAVLNQGAGGNRVLNDGLGPNGLARLDRDVLAQSGARWLIVFEGINDIGTAAATKEAQDQVAEDLIAAYKQIITRAHAQNIIVYGATLLPFAGSSYFDETGFREAARQKVNRWIRTSGRFDGVIDFDKAVRDSAKPTSLAAEFDTGDHLHLNPQGYRTLAEAIPLEFFINYRFPLQRNNCSGCF
ncbi:MAG TPA: SGNH/GDSL hydrolase family protein [Bacillota bacterium]